MKNSMIKTVFAGANFILATTIVSGQITTCEMATEIQASELPLSMVLDTNLMSNDSRVECGTMETDGPDQWFRLTGLDPDVIYSAETSEEEGGEDTLLEVFHGDCDSLESVACADDSGNSPLASLSFFSDRDGSAWILVESNAEETSDTFALSFSRLIPEVEGGSCDIPVVWPEGVLPQTFEVAAGPEANETSVSCASDVKAPDVWVVLPELVPGDYLLMTAPANNSNVTDTRIELFQGTNCDDLRSLVCNDDINTLDDNFFSEVRFTSTGDPLMALVEAAGFDDLNSVTLQLMNAPAPMFDQCDSALDLSGQTIPFQIQQDFTGAQNFARIPCSEDEEGVDRWLELPTLQDDTLYTLLLNQAAGTKQPTGPDYTLAAAIYRGSCTTPILVDCAGEPGISQAITFAGSAGDRYSVHLELVSSGEIPGNIFVDFFEEGPVRPIANPTCITAGEINSRLLPFNDEVSLLGSSTQQAWYSFTPGNTGHHEISASSNQPSAVMTLQVLDGCSGNQVCGSPVTTSSPAFYPWLDEGVTYQIGLSNPAPSTQLFTDFSIEVNAPQKTDTLSNVDCGSATLVNLPFDEVGVTGDRGSLELSSLMGGDSCLGELYYQFQASADGIIVIDVTDEFGTPGTIGVLSGDCTVAVLQETGLSPFQLSARAGETYTVAVENHLFNPDQIINIAIMESAAQTNSFCDSATSIDSVPFVEIFDFSNTVDSGDFIACSASASRPELFWSFTPSESGKYRVTVGDIQTGTDLAVAVLEGSDCSQALSIACSDETESGESIVVDLVGNQEYSFVVESELPGVLALTEQIAFQLEKVSDVITDGVDCANAAFRRTSDFPLQETLNLESNPSTNLYFNGPGHVYEIEVNETGFLRGTVSSITGSPDIAAILVLGNCVEDSPFGKSTLGQTVVELADRQVEGGTEEINFYVIKDDPVFLYIEHQESKGETLTVDLTFKGTDSLWIFF